MKRTMELEVKEVWYQKGGKVFASVRPGNNWKSTVRIDLPIVANAVAVYNWRCPDTYKRFINGKRDDMLGELGGMLFEKLNALIWDAVEKSPEVRFDGDVYCIDDDHDKYLYKEGED